MKPITPYQAAVLDGMARAEAQGVPFSWHSVAWPTRRALLDGGYVKGCRLTRSGHAYVLGCEMGRRGRKVLA